MKKKESTSKRARISDTEIDTEKGSQSDDSEGGRESVGEKVEKAGISLFSYLKLTLLT
jgi:hypothetical protein